MPDDDIIERAAQVFCDSSPHGKRWADHGEPFRDIYRRRVRALADAGLLAGAIPDAELRAQNEWLQNKLGAMVDDAMAEGWQRVADEMEAATPAAEPEPFFLKDVAGDEVGVNSLPGQARISLSVDDIMWLDPDEADQLAAALKAHAAARRADAQRTADA